MSGRGCEVHEREAAGRLRTSPLELKQRTADQSSPAVQSATRHALTMDGMTPSIVTRAAEANSQKGRPVGAPRNRPIAARFRRAA